MTKLKVERTEKESKYIRDLLGYEIPYISYEKFSNIMNIDIDYESYKCGFHEIRYGENKSIDAIDFLLECYYLIREGGGNIISQNTRNARVGTILFVKISRKEFCSESLTKSIIDGASYLTKI